MITKKALVSLLCLFIEDTFVLLKFTMLSEYIFIGGTVAGQLWMRKSQPKRDRPMRVRKQQQNKTITKLYEICQINVE